MFDWKQDPHRRFNPLTREWVLVSPHRTAAALAGPGGDRRRRQRSRNTTRSAISAPAMRARAACATRSTLPPSSSITISPRSSPIRRSDRFEQDGLLVAEAEPGICRVVCFSPKHNLTIANMELGRPAQGGGHLGGAVRRNSAPMPFINYVQIFENRGAMMGASNPHPHCQIWSSRSCPTRPPRNRRSQLEWRARAARACCASTRSWSSPARDRVVEENDAFLTVVPFWAVWPFETMVIAKRHMTAHRRAHRRGARRPGRYPAAHDGALRPRLQRVVPVLDGIPPAAHRRRARTTSGTCTCTSIRRCCARRRCASSWSATRCWPRPQRDITPEAAAERQVDRQVVRAGVLGLDVLEEDALELAGLQSRRDFAVRGDARHPAASFDTSA